MSELPTGVWENPEEQDQEVYDALVAAWNEDSFAEAPIFSALAYFDETPSGGVVCGGCSQWWTASTANSVTTIQVPCESDGFLDVNSSFFDSTSTTVRFGTDGTQDYQSWFHFCSVPIPAGATVVDAYITFTETQVQTNTTTYNNVLYALEDADSALVPTSNSDGQARIRTNQKEHQFAFNALWYGTTQKRSMNLIDVVQEVVDRTGWNSGNLNLWMDYTIGQEYSSPGYSAVASVESGNGAILTVSYTMETVTELNLTPATDGIWSTGSFDTTAITIDYQRFPWPSFYHFTNVTLPQGSTIFLASFEGKSSIDDNHVGGGDLYFEATDNAAVITSNTDGDSRSLTTGTNLIDEAWGIDQIRKDANCNSELQEVVDRLGWNSGNDVQIIVKNPTNNQGRIYSADSTGNEPNLRIMYAKLPIQEVGSGGVVVAGDNQNNFISSDVAAGGSVVSGSALSTSVVNEISTGGVVAGGISVPSVFITIEGGAVVGGTTDLSYTANILTAGGVLVAGDPPVQSGIITSGGVIVGGATIPVGSTTFTPSGGVVCAGTAKLGTVVDEMATGGVVIGQPTFGNGLTHRTTVTVPAGSVAADMVFYLGVRIPYLSDEFLITDLNGQVQSHEVREVAANNTCLFWRCELKADQDNVFLVYFNLGAN